MPFTCGQDRLLGTPRRWCVGCTATRFGCGSLAPRAVAVVLQHDEIAPGLRRLADMDKSSSTPSTSAQRDELGQALPG